MALGGMLGFILGGEMVDRFGTKYVFLYCHFGFSAVLLLLLTRGVLMISPAILMELHSSILDDSGCFRNFYDLRNTFLNFV